MLKTTRFFHTILQNIFHQITVMSNSIRQLFCLVLLISIIIIRQINHWMVSNHHVESHWGRSYRINNTDKSLSLNHPHSRIFLVRSRAAVSFAYSFSLIRHVHKKPACQSIFTRIKPDNDENTHCHIIYLTMHIIKLNTDSGAFTLTINAPRDNSSGKRATLSCATSTPYSATNERIRERIWRSYLVALCASRNWDERDLAT